MAISAFLTKLYFISVMLALCYVYVVYPVDLTPIAYSKLRDLRPVRHPSLVANQW
jgi:hypothetical protein